MKKLILFGAALIMAVSFNSCTGKEESSTTTNNPGGLGGNTQSQATRMVMRIVETSKYDDYLDDDVFYTFDYDTQNRITNWTYKSGQITIIHTYSYSGNKVLYSIYEYGSYGANEYDITLNSDGYAVYIERAYNIGGKKYYDMTDLTYENGYIQSNNINLGYTGGYDNREYTWANGNMTGIYKLINGDPEYKKDLVIRAQYTYDTSREAVPVNIDLASLLVDNLGLYDWDLSPFLGKHSKNLLTKIDITASDLGSSTGDSTTYTLDYKFNSDGTIATMTADYEDSDGDRCVTTYDITYY